MRHTSTEPGSSGYYYYLIPGAVGFVIVVLIPLVTSFALGFTSWKGLGTPTFVGFQNYARLMQDAVFWHSLINTLLFMISMTVVPILLGLFLAAVLFDYIGTKFGSGMSSFFRAGFYLPQILPLSAAGVLWVWILSPVGVVNAVLDAIGLGALKGNWLGEADYALWAVSAVIVWVQLGYCLVVFMSGLARVDPALYEAAQLDNATWFRRFQAITIPMLLPEIFVVALTTMIAALKVFAPIYVLTSGGPDNATTVPSYLTFYYFFTVNRVGYASAIATLQTLLTIGLGVFFLRTQLRQVEGAS